MRLELSPKILEDEEVLTIAMVTVKVGIAKAQGELIELGGCHVSSLEVVQSRGTLTSVSCVCPLNYTPGVEGEWGRGRSWDNTSVSWCHTC